MWNKNAQIVNLNYGSLLIVGKLKKTKTETKTKQNRLFKKVAMQAIVNSKQ